MAFICLIAAALVIGGCLTTSTENVETDILYIGETLKSIHINKYECNDNVLDVVAELNRSIDDKDLPEGHRHGIKIVCKGNDLKGNGNMVIKINMTNVTLKINSG